MRRALAGLGAGDVRRAAGDTIDGVKNRFCSQPTGHRVGIIHLVIFVPFRRADGKLVGARLADDLHQMPRIKSIVHKLLRQVFEQRRIARRISSANVVKRINDSHAGKITPQAICITGGEKAVVRRRQPRREFFPAGRVFLFLMLVGKRLQRRGNLACAQMLNFALSSISHNLVERLAAFNISAANATPLAGVVLLERDSRKISGQMIILVLRPPLERMIMAFVATEPRRKKQLRGVLHRFGRRAENLPITRGGIFAI